MELTTLWSLRKPLVWIWRKLVGVMGKWTVRPILRQSHDYHVALRRWQQRWEELAENIDYKLLTRTPFDEDRHGEQLVWIRNTGDTIVEEIRFCVEAKLGRVSYQVPLVAYRLRPGCMVRLVLPGLPLQDLMIHADQIIATYESLHVYPVQIVRHQQLEIYDTDGLGRHPTHDDRLNGKWQRWEGRLYNVKAIEERRHEIFKHLAYALCWRHGMLGMNVGTLLAQVMRTRRYRRLPGVLLLALLGSRPVLSTILWSRLLLRIERIRFECDPTMTAATEYVLRKGKGPRPVRLVQLDAIWPSMTGLT